MKYDDYLAMIRASIVDDWKATDCSRNGLIASRPPERPRGRRQVLPLEHRYVAAFKANLELSLAWGAGVDICHPELLESWLAPLAAKEPVPEYYLDTHWRGALVDRLYFVDVAGSLLPRPTPVLDEDLRPLRWEAARHHVHLMRLANVLSGRSETRFDDALNATRISIVDALAHES